MPAQKSLSRTFARPDRKHLPRTYFQILARYTVRKALKDFRKAEHVHPEDIEEIPEGMPGKAQADPFLVAPRDWSENGLPYCAWCKCSVCGFVGRSSVAFDYYAEKPGDPLTCESCQYRKFHESKRRRMPDSD
jgi:hypothetical protein